MSLVSSPLPSTPLGSWVKTRFLFSFSDIFAEPWFVEIQKFCYHGNVTTHVSLKRDRVNGVLVKRNSIFMCKERFSYIMNTFCNSMENLILLFICNETLRLINNLPFSLIIRRVWREFDNAREPEESSYFLERLNVL